MERSFCSDESLAREEPLFGTASTIRRWIAVEQSGAWGPDALRESKLGEEASAQLRAIGRACGARVLIVRRHGRYLQSGHEVRVAFSGRGSRWLESLRFESTEALLAHDFTPLKSGKSVGGTRQSEAEVFVCTHGKHDPCCARKGRAIAHELHQEMPAQLWETSHIGGDRFAGNLVVLPLGIYYGRVEPAQAVRLIRELEAGRLALAHYRGRSAYPFAVQAAEWLTRQKLSVFGVDAVTFVSHEELEREGAFTRTVFDIAGGRRVAVEVEEVAAAPQKLTCHASAEHKAPGYELRAFDAG